MFALTQYSRLAQQVVCMCAAVVMVAASVSLGAAMADSAAHQGYSVIVTQL
jgi:hypothetical protein